MDLSTLWPIAVALVSGAAAWGANRVEVRTLRDEVAAIRAETTIVMKLREDIAELKADVRHLLARIERTN